MPRIWGAALSVGVLLALSSGAHAQAKSFYLTAEGDAGAMCIDVASGKAVGGNRIQLWKCHGKAPQKFVLDVAGGKIKYAANPRFCVDQEQGGGRMLELTECQYAWNRWTYDAKSSRVMGRNGLCWDVPSGRYNSQQRLQVWQCHNGLPQKFVFND